MNVNEILAQPAKSVKANVATALFNFFIKHYNVGELETRLAWTNFEKLQKMDISLDLALNTAIALARA